KSSDNFDPMSVSKDRKKTIIKETIGHLTGTQMYDAEAIFQLRYDRESPNSLYAMTNMGNHLITTRHPSFKTERQNLNLVFLNDEDFEANTDYIYFFIPYLLHYAVEVIETLLVRKQILNES